LNLGEAIMTIAHTMPPPGRGKRRAGAFVFALLLQAAFVTALIYGLDIKVWPRPDNGSIQTRFIPTTKVDYPPPKPTPWVQPVRRDLPTPPIFDIDKGRPTAINPDNPGPGIRPGPTDHGALAVLATHTTPPYPPLAIRLEQEGTVLLRLTISPQGVVTGAVVVRSSGYPMLDEAAVAWVTSHWRYQPALRGGVAAPDSATVGVRFDLRNAG
jgi:protein TonB